MSLNYYFQDEAVQSFYDYYGSGKRGNTLIALPTGTGKSHVISKLIQRAMTDYPNQRFICMTHVKELIKQNVSKLLQQWPQAPVGIYSAGLNRKEYMQPIIYGGIGSIKNNVQAFGHRDIVIIDEAHLVSPNAETTYRQVLDEMKAINPHLKVLGLTATKYRLGLGLLTQGGLFDDVIYDMTDVKGFNRLIEEGYLCPLIPRKTHTELDLSGVRIQGGEFVQHELQKAVDKKSVTYQALQELCVAGANREAWLIFATGTQHADNISDMLNEMGIPTASVHSKIPSKLRDQRIVDFKAGILRAIVNNNVLTTGFDHPPLDLIGMLRPTVSSSLWVQMGGRGTRPYPGKENCLLLDYAGNTERLGPINDPKIPRKGSNRAGDAPVKLCEECGTYNHASVRECIFCGHEFPIQEKLTPTSSDKELLKSEIPVVETFDVDRTLYHLHKKLGAPNSMRVTYYTGIQGISEWIHIERQGPMGSKAKQWWLQRFFGANPNPGRMPVKTVEDALQQTDYLMKPKRISVQTNLQFPRVLSYEF